MFNRPPIDPMSARADHERRRERIHQGSIWGDVWFLFTAILRLPARLARWRRRRSRDDRG